MMEQQTSDTDKNRGLKQSFVVFGGSIHYENKETHKKRIEMTNKILESSQSCKCGKIFLSQKGFIAHLKQSKKKCCAITLVKPENQEEMEYEGADTVGGKKQHNELNERSEDGLGCNPVTPRIEEMLVCRATRKLPPKLPKETQKAEALNCIKRKLRPKLPNEKQKAVALSNPLDSGFIEDVMKPDEKVAGSKEKYRVKPVKPVSMKNLKKSEGQRQRSTQPSRKRRLALSTDTDLKTSSCNVQRKFWCRQQYCDTFHPSIEALRTHVTKAHRGVDASQINEFNYCTYGLGIGPVTLQKLA
ncbi:unnamed protein product [Orchesella dallaii]|uniref:C2H2-type domain-containing protein n=1 Tax=Orchesella dallaii TaxID=48710 RepID=A0ABP1QCZ9_9HEXA